MAQERTRGPTVLKQGIGVSIIVTMSAVATAALGAGYAPEPQPRGLPTTSTAYCLSGVMADGSYVRAGSVAHNGYALGTHITVRPAFVGRHRFIVRDRIGWGTQLDFWTPYCGTAFAWGRRTVRVRKGWTRVRAQWRGGRVHADR